MKLILFILIVFKTGVSVAQKSSVLQGKWRFIAISQVISTSRDSLFYDLDKDSMYLPSEDLKEAFKDGLDSVQTVNLFKSMYESYKNSWFIFTGDSVSLEYNTSTVVGTFQVKNKNTLDLLLVFEENDQEHLTYQFFLKDDLLTFLQKQDMGYTRFVLKKE